MSTTPRTITSEQTSQPITVQIENPTATQPTGLNWLTLISTLLLATTAAINFFTARSSYKNRQDSKKLQRLTLMSELQKQYYFLLFDLKNKVEKQELKPSDYYRRYWIEREYEFILFRNEFIDEKTYTQWLLSEKSDYQLNEPFKNKEGKIVYTYQQGYEESKKFFASRTTIDSNSKVFFNFMDDVFEPNLNSVENAIKKIKKLPKN